MLPLPQGEGNIDSIKSYPALGSCLELHALSVSGVLAVAVLEFLA
jgi:hypothetical protein